MNKDKQDVNQRGLLSREEGSESFIHNHQNSNLKHDLPRHAAEMDALEERLFAMAKSTS